MQLAVSVATGRPWFGHYPVSRTIPQRVVLLLGEEDHTEVRRRIFAVADALQLTDYDRRAVAESVVVLPLAGQVCPLLALEAMTGTAYPTPHLDALRKNLDTHASDGWSLVVLDPQCRFAGVDVEVNNALATRFVQECESLTTAPGNPTVLVVAHSSKLSRRMGEADSRGVTGLTDGFRWHATLKAEGQDVLFNVAKNNYGRPSEPIRLVRHAHGILLAETEQERQGREARQRAAAEAHLDERDRARPGVGFVAVVRQVNVQVDQVLKSAVDSSS